MSVYLYVCILPVAPAAAAKNGTWKPNVFCSTPPTRGPSTPPKNTLACDECIGSGVNRARGVRVTHSLTQTLILTVRLI